MKNIHFTRTQTIEKQNCRKKKIDLIVDSPLYNSDKAYQQSIDKTLKKVIL